MKITRAAARAVFFTTSSNDRDRNRIRILVLLFAVRLHSLAVQSVRAEPHVKLLAAADVVVEVLRFLTTIIRRLLDPVGLIREILLERVDFHLLLAGHAGRLLLDPGDRRA